MNKRIWLSSPHMGGTEILYVKNAFDTNWVAPLGPNVDQFELELENYLGEKCKVTALNSGTSALHMSLILLGIKKGDEFLCQTLTFAATVNPIIYQGATPIFIDSEMDTWNISPDILEKAIKDRIKKGNLPKAIIIVHLYGMPAQMDKLMQISKKYKIPLIEDAAEALGSKYKNKKLGTFGDFGIISFNGNKIITTSGGGAIVSNNAALITRAKFLSSQAKEPAPYFHHTEIGYNYRMSNICAGIGRGQMEVLSLRVFQRRRNFLYYKRLLNGFVNIEFQDEPDIDYMSNRWLTAIMINDDHIKKEDLRLYLEKQNIEARHVWKPMHLQPVFASHPFYGDGTSENIFDKGLCLPSGSNLNNLQLNRVIKEITKAIELILIAQ